MNTPLYECHASLGTTQYSVQLAKHTRTVFIELDCGSQAGKERGRMEGGREGARGGWEGGSKGARRGREEAIM